LAVLPNAYHPKLKYAFDRTSIEFYFLNLNITYILKYYRGSSTTQKKKNHLISFSNNDPPSDLYYGYSDLGYVKTVIKVNATY